MYNAKDYVEALEARLPSRPDLDTMIEHAQNDALVNKRATFTVKGLGFEYEYVESRLQILGFRTNLLIMHTKTYGSQFEVTASPRT